MYEDTTYGFEQVIATIQNPLVGQMVITGEGVGSISWGYTDNNVESDVAADGDVMVSKVRSRRGTISLEVQQTSPVNKWLHNLANVQDNASPDQLLATSVRVSENFKNGILATASRAAIQKRPDKKDEAQGGRVTWVLFTPDLTTE